LAENRWPRPLRLLHLLDNLQTPETRWRMKTAPSQAIADKTFITMGYWAALLCGIAAACYGVSSIIIGATAASDITWVSLEKFVAGYRLWVTILILTPPFLVTLIFPVFAVSLLGLASEQRKPLAIVAIVFAGIYSAVLGSGYWEQLTFIPQAILEGNHAGLPLSIMWHPRSSFWAFESFGYFMMGVSSAFAGLALSPARTSRLARVLMIVLAPLGLLFMINEAAGMWFLASFMPLFLVFSWVIVFSIAAFSLFKSFRAAR
jgi:hypothetical protein